jgi:hypothetical protein
MTRLRPLLRIYEKKSNPKMLKTKKFFAARSCLLDKKKVYLEHNSITKDWNLVKISVS